MKSTSKIRRIHWMLVLSLVLSIAAASCSPVVVQPLPVVTPHAATQALPTFVVENPTSAALPTNQPQSGNTSAPGKLPVFSHIIVIILENEESSNIIGNGSMPNMNKLAQQYTVLTNYYAVRHPSLPNYIAMTSGDTQGISSDCIDCFVNQTNLMDLIEKSGRTWTAYMEDMPAACTLGNQGKYAQKHNPFVYYDDIRTNTARCQKDDVPYSQFDSDLKNNQLPAFAWITPNLCNDAHDCPVATADQWLGPVVDNILNSPAFDQNSLLIITFDEGTTNIGCCGLPSKAGGKIATLLVSKLVKPGFQDDTAYTHYSLLKTIETSWGLLPLLGHSADAGTTLISAPWK
ncbi:MAG: alkaline phosphatase family protein [Anaerolineaceae bacterium]|nr:alkaline phosphatase family protein [Anaerolineaceae bacterium]